MPLFEREEYDPEQGTWQRLAPATQAGRTADLDVGENTYSAFHLKQEIRNKPQQPLPVTADQYRNT
jgi:hypothetical protein